MSILNLPVDNNAWENIKYQLIIIITKKNSHILIVYDVNLRIPLRERVIYIYTGKLNKPFDYF